MKDEVVVGMQICTVRAVSRLQTRCRNLGAQTWLSSSPIRLWYAPKVVQIDTKCIASFGHFRVLDPVTKLQSRDGPEI
jgi:hypothetical protein